jgi:hypothetical protein
MTLSPGLSRAVSILAFSFAALAQTHAAYVADFEPAIFSPGVINGQDQWTTPASVEQSARVLTTDQIVTEFNNTGRIPGMTVHSGSQALLVSGAGNSSATIRQIGGLETERYVGLSVWVRPLTAGSTGAPTGNIFLTMEDSAGDRAAAFRFGFVGGVQTIDYGTSIAGIWQATGLQWSDDTWYNFSMIVDYGTKTYDFAVNGTKVNANPIPFYTAASDDFRQVRIFRGANQAGMLMDDIAVQPVPEPATQAILAMTGVALGFRRMRRGR